MSFSFKSKVYHGSNQEIRKPVILTDGFTKDFGFGFYCTSIESQAQGWSMRKDGRNIVNCYTVEKLDDSLNVLIFDNMSEEWLDFIADCRSGKTHNYDIVEGPMADDKIFNYVESFLENEITREQFWALAKFNHPTHQIAFCTKRALDYLTFERSYEYEK